MGKVIMSGIVPQLAEPVAVNPVFENNTWDAIIKAVQKNKVPDTWVVGDSKTMKINGTDYLIDIIGKNHDTYADGTGKAPLTFQLHDCYGTTYMMNSSKKNNGGWTSSAMRTTHLPAILALMPSEVQSGIRKVNKMTSAGYKSSTINTDADNLFLLSEIEIFGSTTYSVSGEGSQYAYYASGNSKNKYFSGASSQNYHWWERSPYSGDIYKFCYTVSGTATLDSANTAKGVSFAFCF